MFGIIDVGGGTRDIFGAGVLDYCMDHGVMTDAFIGVSAGTANGMAYLAGQRGRNYRFYQDYEFRQEYMGILALLKTGSWANLDYIYSTLSNEDGEDPLDYDAFERNPSTFDVVATDAETGKPVYFTRADLSRNHYDVLKASSCVPVFCRPYPIQGRRYFDGGISDPIPLRYARQKGVDRLAIILTRPRDGFRTSGRDDKMVRLLRHRFPQAARAMHQRAETYNASLREAHQGEAEGWIKIIAPEDISGLRTLTRDHEKLEALYQEGYRKGEGLAAFYREE